VSAGRVITEGDVPWQPLPDGWVRVPIDAGTGSTRLLQRVFRYAPGATPELENDASEEAMFVVSGRGELVVAGEALELGPGAAIYVPPRLAYRVENPGPHDLTVVSVLSPQPSEGAGPEGRPRPSSSQSDAGLSRLARTTEADEQALPAGGDRYFKLLIDPRHGCRNVTQFIGFISKSKAPPHTHTYEEAISILEGEGIVHIFGVSGERQEPIRSGTSIFLPPGTPHCLENRSEGVLKLLGVFSPAGSPADKQE
jgi:mannose-6-phosphate isomerase-like protein (cupin superfamily)